MTQLYEAGGDPGGHGLQARLFELGLLVSDMDRSRAFYEAALGYRFQPHGHGAIGVARDRRLYLGVSDTGQKGFSHAAFAVADADEMDRLRARLDGAAVVHDEIDHPGFGGHAVGFADPDGNRLIFGVPSVHTVVADTTALTARLQHVVFASRDIAAMLAFYRDVVGFGLSDCVENDDGELTTFFVHCSHEHHSLAVFRASECRLDHHCFEAGDWGLIRDWADHFAALHIPLQWGPGRHGPGNNLFLFIHDPDGHWLEISAELETLTPDRKVGVWPHAERTLNSWGMALLRK
ncbi:VOC family protein [Sphingomonas sp. CGMCC 1.13654]|uniref:VOC family protein n=1 Tax=Sphingomonas chungangi TaxID=2683589 RepID=A0A838L464_9SPHN|nr:VOC family protein [Sphingomonas chungangi]MBA2933485.1 VOC family protein [Sphingomonas chungangi]MVW54818.1 bleomycin resistance protein [Sphingomonas chungangi]